MITDGESRNMLGFFGTGNVFDGTGEKFAYASNSRTGMLFDVWVMDPLAPETARLVFEARRPGYYVPAGWFDENRKLVVLEYISANQVNSYIVDTVSGDFEMIDPKCEGTCVFALFQVSGDGSAAYGLTDRRRRVPGACQGRPRYREDRAPAARGWMGCRVRGERPGRRASRGCDQRGGYRPPLSDGRREGSFRACRVGADGSDFGIAVRPRWRQIGHDSQRSADERRRVCPGCGGG